MTTRITRIETVTETIVLYSVKIRLRETEKNGGSENEGEVVRHAPPETESLKDSPKNGAGDKRGERIC